MWVCVYETTEHMTIHWSWASIIWYSIYTQKRLENITSSRTFNTSWRTETINLISRKKMCTVSKNLKQEAERRILGVLCFRQVFPNKFSYTNSRIACKMLSEQQKPNKLYYSNKYQRRRRRSTASVPQISVHANVLYALKYIVQREIRMPVI